MVAIKLKPPTILSPAAKHYNSFTYNGILTYTNWDVLYYIFSAILHEVLK